MFKKLISYVAIFSLCLMMMIPNVSAEELLPDPPAVSGMKHVITLKYAADKKYYAHFFDTSHGLEFEAVEKQSNGYRVKVKSSDGEYMAHRYFAYENGGWVERSPNEVQYLYLFFNDASELYYSYTPLLNADGSVFFSVRTMAEMILGVVKEAIPIKVGAIHQQMMIIALCGVGCLALLIGYQILPKILSRFLA